MKWGQGAVINLLVSSGTYKGQKGLGNDQEWSQDQQMVKHEFKE